MDVVDQETASIARFILAAAPELTPYYRKMPQDFVVPSVYFPRPVAVSRGETLLTYALEIDWYITFFASEDAYAQEYASIALNAICAARRLIPLVDKAGEKIEEGIRLDDPELTQADDGAFQLHLRWVSRRPYTQAETVPAGKIEFSINKK